MEEEALQDHVEELRKRLKYSALALVSCTVVGYYFSSDILAWLQQDLAFSLNALTAYEVFYTQLTIALLAGFILSFPFIFYQVLMFVKPGLKQREYRILVSYLPLSVVLFTSGAVFGYQVVSKAALSFFSSATQSSDVAAVWGLRSTLSFVLQLSALNGIVFQIPVAALVLSKAGLLGSESMKLYRKHFLVAALLLAAVASPPDVLSQVMIFVPVAGLYELSILLVTFVEK